ncbi:hypothetical protein VNO80_13134 [Phaseolus coccineus]|uniref:Polygalacturonase n=1 Tax=Phaseolus coccineus TaxID=3886 RepID=A0AAN9N180_PHACN
MDLQLKMITFALFLLLVSSSATAQFGVFDISKYGAVPNGDITQALTNAWSDACASTTPGKVVISRGIYNLKQIEFKGPCMALLRFKLMEQFKHHKTQNGRGANAWTQNNCAKNKSCKKLSMNFGFGFLNNTIVRDITSKDNKYFHVSVLGCNNITFTNFKIVAPTTSPNTDGIHIGRSTHVNIDNTNIATGDDCISLGDGSKQITVLNVTCGPGHGTSVGSLGKYPNEERVEDFFVRNCILNNSDNGVRIKTWPDTPETITVTGMHFKDIKMINVKNPIIIDQEYCP